MADGGGHPAHLAIPALHQFNSHPTVRNSFAIADGRMAWRNGRLRVKYPGATGQRLSPLDPDSPLKRLQGRWQWNTLHLRPVNTAMSAPRMQQPMVQLRLVAQQQQAFAVGVQPADGIHARRETEFRQRAQSGVVRRKLRNHTVRFVEGDEHQTDAARTLPLHDVPTSRAST